MVIIAKDETLCIERQRRDSLDMLYRAATALQQISGVDHAPLRVRQGRSKMGRPQLVAIFPTCAAADAAYEWFAEHFDPRP